MTVHHKLKRPIPFFYYLLCRPASSAMLSHKWAWRWKSVTCPECCRLGGKKYPQ